MNHRSLHALPALGIRIAVVAFGLAILGSCGSDPGIETTSGDTVSEPETTSHDDNTSDSTMNDDPPSDSGPDDTGPDDSVDATPATADAGEQVIGTANMGGEIVDPKVHPVDDLLIAESYPEQLMISFTAGDEPCLAATATALGSDNEVRVVLEVGITTDALTRSCLAGEFSHTLSVALSEGLDGRPVVIQEAAVDEQDAAPAEPAPQPFETTLIGMSEQSAREAAESFGYRWRVLSIDGEDLAGTADYDEQRINAKIVDGAVTETWLG